MTVSLSTSGRPDQAIFAGLPVMRDWGRSASILQYQPRAREDTMPDARSSGLRIHYELEGEGPLLILHHGLGGAGEDFVELGYVKGLQALRRLARIDARGHGQSDKPHDREAYAAQLMAEDVIAVLDDVGIDRADFFGYSMGGRVAYALAKYAPARIRSYIIGGSAPYGLPEDTIRRLWSGLKGGPDGLMQFATAEGPLPPGMEAGIRGNDFDALRAFFTSRTVVPDPLDDVAQNLQAPCLLFVGQDDFACAGMKKVAGEMPNATFVIIEGLGHTYGFTRSDLVLPHVTAFLRKVDRENSTGGRNTS